LIKNIIKIKEEIKQLSFNSKAPQVTEEYLRSVFSEVKNIVKTNNMPEIKRFMNQYIERVEVFEDYVRVVFILYIIVVVMNGGGGGNRTHRPEDRPQEILRAQAAL